MLVLNPSIYCYMLVLAAPRSLATTYGITIVFFSCRYLDVSVPYVSPHYTTFSCNDIQTFTLDEFPHSDICGSQTICVSPQLFAACHVLHRLLIPRHSPYALISLTFYLSILFFWILFIRLFPSLIILRVTYISIIAQHNLLCSTFDTCYLCLFISIFVVIIHYIVFNVQFGPMKFYKSHGGPKWNRTIDLTLIRRAL